jgi:hypothetical protein
MKSPLRTLTRKRTVYDAAALVEMGKTMSKRDIIEKTGISRAHLNQLFIAKGLGRRARKRRGDAEDSGSND